MAKKKNVSTEKTVNEEAVEALIENAASEDSIRKIDPRNSLNDLTAAEWIPETISVWTQRGLGANHPDAQIEKLHPAPFSFTDVSRLVKFFTKAGQTVLDPFVGIGSTLKACALEGRNGIGFELSPKYAELAKERLAKEVNSLFACTLTQDVRQGDARDLVKQLPENSIDFVVTSPPYWNILHKIDTKVKHERKDKELDTQYSNDPSDLGNIDSYEKFIEELGSILGGCAKALKPKKYMAVIVSDFREKSRYIMFHADLAQELQKFNLSMKGLTILYQRHKKIFPYGYPYSYVPNVHNQFIMILQNDKSGPTGSGKKNAKPKKAK